MRRDISWSPICALLLLFGGCPKRQTSRSMVVYVPTPPPAAAPATEKPQVLVIAEPAPPPEPEPEEPPVPQTPEPAVQHRQHRPAHTETPAASDETAAPESHENTPAAVPALEPRESSAQETELRRQFLSLEQSIEQRLTRLSASNLAANDRRTLEDARTFLAQARQAMASGDLPRALNLARKASLLVAALE